MVAAAARKAKTLLREGAKEGSSWVGLSCLLINARTRPTERRPFRQVHRSLPFHSPLAFALFVALAPQQFPIDLGDLFQVLLNPVIVVDPFADLLHLLGGYDSPSSPARSERHG